MSKYCEFVRDLMYYWSRRIVIQESIKSEDGLILGWRFKVTDVPINGRVIKYLDNKGYEF